MSDKPNTPETDASAHALTIEHGIALLEPHPNGRWAPIEVARRLEVARDQARTEVEQLRKHATYKNAIRLEKEITDKANENTEQAKTIATLRAQLAQRDEALKETKETIMELGVQLEHVESLRLNDCAPTPATLTPNILATGRAALRRIEELTKEKQPHE